MSKMFVVIAVFFGALIIAQAFFGRPSSDEKKLARGKVKEGALVVDVRTPDEFASGHYDGATNIPVQELKNRISELGAKDRAIVVYCRSGARAGTAKTTLTKDGFTNVLNAGGLADLKQSE